MPFDFVCHVDFENDLKTVQQIKIAKITCDEFEEYLKVTQYLRGCPSAKTRSRLISKSTSTNYISVERL